MADIITNTLLFIILLSFSPIILLRIIQPLLHLLTRIRICKKWSLKLDLLIENKKFKVYTMSFVFLYGVLGIILVTSKILLYCDNLQLMILVVAVEITLIISVFIFYLHILKLSLKEDKEELEEKTE